MKLFSNGGVARQAALAARMALAGGLLVVASYAMASGSEALMNFMAQVY